MMGSKYIYVLKFISADTYPISPKPVTHGSVFVIGPRNVMKWMRVVTYHKASHGGSTFFVKIKTLLWNFTLLDS